MSGINVNGYAPNINTFKSANTNAVTAPKAQPTEGQTKKKDNTKLYATLAGVGVLTTAAAIYYFTKGHTKINTGKLADEIKQGENIAEQAKNATREATSTATHGATSETKVTPKAPKPVKLGESVDSSMPEYNYEGKSITQPKSSWFVTPREFAPHSYKSEDIPIISITTRGPENDYHNYLIKNGQQNRGGGHVYREPANFVKYDEVLESGKTILVVGKNSNGEKTVWLQAGAGRTDYTGTPIRTQYVMTVPEGQDFTKVQKDLMKGLYGRSQEELTAEMPLSRSVEKIVANPHRERFSSCCGDEDELFNVDTMMREVNHYAQGRDFSPELLEKINSVDSLKNGEFIRLI